MWHSFDGPFILAPKQAAVFRAAASFLSDLVWEGNESDCFETGIPVFDGLSQGQKQCAILTVAKALLDPHVEPPRVTAALASAVHAVFCQLEALVEMESDSGEVTEMRQMVLDAVAETDYWQEIDVDEVKSAASDDLEEWNDLIEVLRSEILEDHDFELDSNIADLDPERAEELKKLMNINLDYFVAVVDDPPAERLEEIRAEIRKLLY